jgi:hypothetical protein
MTIGQRHYYRIPIFGPVRYEVQKRKGYGTVTNLSCRGWKIYGNMPLRAGDVCSLKVRLAATLWVSVLVGIVRWAQGEESGIETMVMNDESTERLNRYIAERMKAF